ncbi:hypothetical protein ABPG72_012026 [Tetrahymena utriculariae]
MRTNKQSEKKGYQEFDSNDEDQNLSNNSNFDDSSSDKNSANMGSAPEDSNDDDEDNNNYDNNYQARQKQAKGQENPRGIQNRQGQYANAKTIQMTDLRQNQNYGNERQKQQQLQKNNYNDNDEEDEIPIQNYNQQRVANQSSYTRSLNQMKDQKSQLVQQRDQKNQQYQNSSDEEEEDDVEYNPNKQKKDNKQLIASQQGQNQFSRNQNQLQAQKKVPLKPAISKIAQNIKGQQKHVKLVEEDEEDIQQQNHHEEEEDEEEEIDEANYQQKSNKLKEEKEIRQRLSDERKRELEKNKKKKKSTKLDADENEENDDDDDEDDDDDDEYDYDYDDFNDENRKKREEYDFSNTITYWIGFVIIVVFMSILYYFMIQRGFTTSYRDQQQNKQPQNKPVLLYSQSSYPLDVYFLNEHWKSIKHLQDSRDEATCKLIPSFDFSIQISSDKTRFFSSYINIECQNQCQILEIQENLQNNEVQQKDQVVPKLSFEDLVKEYKCDDERKYFFEGECQECKLCLECSQFADTCYSCYEKEYLTNKKCQTNCDGQQSVIADFCIQPKPKMNLQTLKGMKHNIYILHTPESPQSFKDQLQKQQIALEEAKKLAQTNSTTQNKTEETEINKKEEFKLNKYPFVFLLNDYRYTQDDVFLTKQVEKYFDQFFLLSIPYFKDMLLASELDNLIDEIIDNTLDYDIKQFVDFYSIMGYGLTGQLAIQIGLEQKEFYYKKRVSLVTAVSDNSFLAIINHDSNSFESYIQQNETYYKDHLFCYLSQKKKQIKSTKIEFKKGIEADNQESKLHDHLDFYLKHSFDEILFHSKNQKLSQKF